MWMEKGKKMMLHCFFGFLLFVDKEKKKAKVIRKRRRMVILNLIGLLEKRVMSRKVDLYVLIYPFVTNTSFV
jgi:hypothetical protein